MAEEELAERLKREKEIMDEVFKSIENLSGSETAKEFFSMAENYYKDSSFFFDKKDFLRSFEAIVISWSYIDAGIKAGFFSVPDTLKEYFTS